MQDNALNIKFNRSDWYIASWCLYYLQGTLYGESSTLSKTLFVVNMGVALFYVFYVNIRYTVPSYIKGLNWLLSLFVVYGVVLLIDRGPSIVVNGEVFSNSGYIKPIVLSLCPIYAFYEFARSGFLTKEKLKFWIVAFFVVTTCSFFYEQQKRIMTLLESGSKAAGVTNNASYVFLGLIPLLIFYRKHLFIQYIALAYCLYFVVSGMKRGAILIAVICLCVFIYQSFRQAASKQKMLLCFLIIALIYIGYMFISADLMQDTYFQTRLEETLEGQSSGRNEIYSNIWEVYKNSDLFNLIFGFGANGTMLYTAKFAHSDWLEILMNQGILGVSVYLLYWCQFYRSWKKTRNEEIKTALGLLLLILLIKSVFSMSYASYTFYINSLLGFCVANLSREENEQ